MRLAKIAFKLKEKACKLRICAFLYRGLNFMSGASIGQGATFQNMPCFPHGLHGVFISGDAKIGENCVIFHGVTIGSNRLKDSKNYGAPTLGNNVYIGANACIIGNVRVGNNVRIGAGAVVSKNVPDNSTVIKYNEILQYDTPPDNRFFRKKNGNWEFYQNGDWISDNS